LLIAEGDVKCVEPSISKQKRHPSPPIAITSENTPEDSKIKPLKPQKTETDHAKAESGSKASEPLAEAETMYNDGEHRAAVVSNLHPKLQAAASSCASALSLQFGLTVSLWHLITMQ
jgi:hypothetical protein